MRGILLLAWIALAVIAVLLDGADHALIRDFILGLLFGSMVAFLWPEGWPAFLHKESRR